MERVSIETDARDPYDEDSDRRDLSDPLGTSEMAINHYRVAPGDGLPGGLHSHMDQEEVYLVLAGEMSIETMAGSETVTAGEAVSFDRGEFHTGRNDSDTNLVVLALGAPRETDDIRLPAACPACGNENLQMTLGEAVQPVAVCQDCQTTFDQPPLQD
ncbi:MAG: cupin domain-containing protein [Haloarcula sp.]